MCPRGQCLNNDCTICKRGTFADPDVDRFYSTERGAGLSTEEDDEINTKETSVDSTANEPASAPSPEESTKGDSEANIETGKGTEDGLPEDSLLGESSATAILLLSSSFFGIFSMATIQHLLFL